MKLCLVSDLHFGVRNDSVVFYDFFEKFYKNVFIPYLLDNDIKIVICLGDTFDKRKAINYVSFEKSIEQLFDPLSKNGIGMYCLVGNHDAPYKDNIRTSSPKLLLTQFKNITVIDEPQELTIYDKHFLFVPWVCADNQASALNAIKNTTADIMIGHLELSGFEMHKGQLSDHSHFEIDLLKKFDKVWSGHYHHRSSKGNVTYLGNPYELTWNDYDDPRGFHVYDCENDLLEFIQNPYKMFHKYFYNDEGKPDGWVDDIDFSQFSGANVKVIIVKKTDFLAYETFIHKMDEANAEDYKVIEDYSEFEESIMDNEDIESVDSTITLIQKYIDSVATVVNKEPLKVLMDELYKDAVMGTIEGE